MKRWLYSSFIAVLFSFTAVYSQEIQSRLELGKREPLPTAFAYSHADKGLVTLGNTTRRSSRYLSLRKYDAAFELEWTEQLLEQNGRKYVDILTPLGSSIYVFVSEHFPGNNLIETYYYKYSLEGRLLERAKRVASSPNEKAHRVDLDYTKSINLKKLLCYKILNQKKDNETVEFYLFDSEYSTPEQGEIIFPHRDDKFAIRQVEVSNTGDLFFLGKLYKENKIRTPEDYEFLLYRYSIKQKKLEEVSLDANKDYYFTDVRFAISPKQEVFVAGFYSYRDVGSLIGTFFQRYDSSLNKTTDQTDVLKQEILNTYLSERQKRKGKEIQDFYLDNLILRSDGGIVLIAERFYIQLDSYVDFFGNWTDRKIYHYEDILVSSISPEGKIEWNAIAPKNQASTNPEPLSYTDIISGANLYLVYEYSPRRSRTGLYYYKINLQGDVSPNSPLIKPISEDVYYYPRFSEQINNYEALIVFYLEKSKLYTIAKVRF